MKYLKYIFSTQCKPRPWRNDAKILSQQLVHNINNKQLEGSFGFHAFNNTRQQDIVISSKLILTIIKIFMNLKYGQRYIVDINRLQYSRPLEFNPVSFKMIEEITSKQQILNSINFKLAQEDILNQKISHYDSEVTAILSRRYFRRNK